MPETRYREVYEHGTGKLLKTEPYEVSDEQLAAEALVNTDWKALWQAASTTAEKLQILAHRLGLE